LIEENAAKGRINTLLLKNAKSEARINRLQRVKSVIV
jgi:hypothetical protein